MAIFYRFKH